MSTSTPDVRNLTQLSLSELVKQHENKEGSTSRFVISGYDAEVTIRSEYISGSGPHRAWKYIYYLKLNGQRLGGHDRRDSFVAWAVSKIKECSATPELSGALAHGLVMDESLALAMDEGQNSSNGWRLREHFNHGLDNLAHRVEGVLIRNNVVEAA